MRVLKTLEAIVMCFPHHLSNPPPPLPHAGRGVDPMGQKTASVSSGMVNPHTPKASPPTPPNTQRQAFFGSMYSQATPSAGQMSHPKPQGTGILAKKGGR